VPSAKMHRVLITGAGGRIGRGLRETLRGVYPILRLSDLVPIAEARDGEEADQTNIADVKAVERMVQGCDGIIHLGGISGENTWEKILEGNIVGLYNTFEAARQADAHHCAPPAQNRTGGIPAYGSHLGCLTAKR
jgi:uronate dehydrogenase